MFTIIETPTYLRSIESIWSADEAAEFVTFISENPEAGDVMVGCKGLRKVRWKREGSGKRGGVRAIYLLRTERGEIRLLMAYTKAKFDTLPNEFLLKLKDRYDV